MIKTNANIKWRSVSTKGETFLRFFILFFAVALLIAVRPAEAGFVVAIQDNFNRPDGSVDNGWTDMTVGTGTIAPLEIVSNKVSSPVPAANGNGGIFRPFSFTAPTKMQATITETDGFDLVGGRFENQFFVLSDGSVSNGYGISVNRTEADTNNSGVQLWDNGTMLDSVLSPFQFNSSLDVDFTISLDGAVSGSITEGTDVFNFSFTAPGSIDSSGTNMLYTQNLPSPGSTMPATLDNLVVSTKGAVPVPPAALFFGSGLAGLVAVGRRRLKRARTPNSA